MMYRITLSSSSATFFFDNTGGHDSDTVIGYFKNQLNDIRQSMLRHQDIFSNGGTFSAPQNLNQWSMLSKRDRINEAAARGITAVPLYSGNFTGRSQSFFLPSNENEFREGYLNHTSNIRITLLPSAEEEAMRSRLGFDNPPPPNDTQTLIQRLRSTTTVGNNPPPSFRVMGFDGEPDYMALLERQMAKEATEFKVKLPKLGWVSINKTTFVTKKKKMNDIKSMLPVISGEATVGLSDLATDLAMARLESEGLSLDKNLERFSRYLLTYADIIKKSTSKDE